MLVKIKTQIGLIAMCMRGSHPGCQGEFQYLWHSRDKNQNWKYENATEFRSWESDNTTHSRIKGMLDMVMEKVLSTDSGIRELKGDLLELTQTVKYHDISIRNLEDRMNHLASQMRLEMSVKEMKPLVKNVTPSQQNINEEDIEKTFEEILFKESLEVILFNNIVKSSEGLKEACHAIA
ncbi:hypothetical protein HAX54_028340, partial [Datura stramonium]|nr:hypothetical protein [Datura stramonium]